jgi:threonine dehydratase
MPINTPDIKVANVRRLGGLVELIGESYQEAQAYAQVGGCHIYAAVVTLL